MKRNIDCIGFEAPEGMVSFMSESLSELQHLSPYDSYVDARVEKNGDTYVIVISIKHADGKFSAKAKGPQLEQVIIQSADEIIRQVRQWQRNRFTENARKKESNAPLYLSYQNRGRS